MARENILAHALSYSLPKLCVELIPGGQVIRKKGICLLWEFDASCPYNRTRLNGPKAIFCWSGGKDSALALYDTLQSGTYDVCHLLTTINAEVNRISMHGVREELLEQQAASIGINLLKMNVREGSYDEYEREMEALLLKVKGEGVTHVIFGDIFLEDLRLYRENNLAKVGMQAVFPLWKQDTGQLIHRFLALKFRTITCCVNDRYLNKDMVGAELNEEFINNLPAPVDPCGENGEFHTFCFSGPLFHRDITFTIGEKVFKPIPPTQQEEASSAEQTAGFWYCDLIPSTIPAGTASTTG